MRRRKLTPTQCAELWDRYEGKCWRCKLPIDKHKRDSWHWGHILALSCGGEDKPANMAPECRNCNETDARDNVTPLAAKIKRIKRRHIGAKEQSAWSKRYHAMKEWKLKRPRMCSDCGKYPADPPSSLCPGCEAYREHTGF